MHGRSLIDGVFFDFDGVVTRDPTGSATTIRFLAQATDVSSAQWHAALAPHNRSLNLGRTSHAAIWPAICQSLGRRVDLSLLEKAFDSTPIDSGLLSLARSLRARARVGLITDNKLDRMDRLIAQHGLDQIFDPLIVSSRLGADKRDRPLFDHALRVTGLDAERCLFIDNDPKNLRVAEALGWRTLLFVRPDADARWLKRFLSDCFGLTGAMSSDESC